MNTELIKGASSLSGVSSSGPRVLMLGYFIQRVSHYPKYKTHSALNVGQGCRKRRLGCAYPRLRDQMVKSLLRMELLDSDLHAG